jgi:hypothetical protein
MKYIVSVIVAVGRLRSRASGADVVIPIFHPCLWVRWTIGRSTI